MAPLAIPNAAHTAHDDESAMHENKTTCQKSIERGLFANVAVLVQVVHVAAMSRAAAAMSTRMGEQSIHVPAAAAPPPGVDCLAPRLATHAPTVWEAVAGEAIATTLVSIVEGLSVGGCCVLGCCVNVTMHVCQVGGGSGWCV
jgi:hypothetical protein